VCVYTANHKCYDGYVNCGGSSPTRVCVRQDWLCDGDDNCGNGWDEDAEMCGQFTY